MPTVLLDTTHGNYAALAAAVLARGQALYGATFQLDARVMPSNADLALVDLGPITEGELAADADLEAVLTAITMRLPNALVQDVYVDAQDLLERGFPMLGEMGRSAYPEMAGVRYIAQPGTVSGDDDGLTPWTAFDPESAAINGGTNKKLQGGYQYFLIGVVHKVETSAFSFAGRYLDFADASGGPRIEPRSDHPAFPGILLGTMTDKLAGMKGEPWVHEGGNIYSQADWGRAAMLPFQSFLIVTSAVDPTDSFTDILEKAFYKLGASATTLNPGEWFLDAGGEKIYVRLLDDSAPGADFNISTRWDNAGGYFLKLHSDVNGTPRNIRCTNLRTLAITQTNWAGCRDLEVLGGQHLLNANNFLLSLDGFGWKWGASGYGRLTYDRSDIKDENGNVVDNTHYLIQELIATKGSPAAAWADMDRWACVWGQDNGPYQNNTTAATATWVDGLYVIQTHGSVSNSRGVIRTWSAGDGHGNATRGGLNRSNTIMQRFVLLRGGRHLDHYLAGEANADAPYDFGGTLRAGNYQNNIVQDFLILDDNGAATGIAHGGIGVEHDNDHVIYKARTGVCGRKDGSVFRRFAIANLPGTAIINVSEQAIPHEDYIIENCDTHYTIGRNFTESVPFVAIVTNGEATVTEVTENLLLGSGGDPTQINLVNTDDYIVFGFLDTPSRLEPVFGAGSVAAAGTYTLAIEKYTAGGWVAVSSLTNGTNGLKQTGEIRHARDGSEILADLYGESQLAFLRIRLASGGFTTPPTITQVRGRLISAVMHSRGATVRFGAKSKFWNRSNSGIYEFGSRYEDVDDFTLDIGSLVAESANIFNDGGSAFYGWKTQPDGWYKLHTEANSDIPKGKADNRAGNVDLDDIVDAHTAGEPAAFNIHNDIIGENTAGSTFNRVLLGHPHPDRAVAIAVTGACNLGFPGGDPTVLLDGVSLGAPVATVMGSNGNLRARAHIYALHQDDFADPDAEIGVVTVTYSGQHRSKTIHVHRLVGFNLTPVDTLTASNASPLTGTLTLAALGYAIACAKNGNSGAAAWTGVAEQFDADGFGRASAGAAYPTAAGDATIACQFTSPSVQSALAAAAFALAA